MTAVQIEQVAWAVQPGTSGTRPTFLLAELQKLGVVSASPTIWYHGRTSARDGWMPAGILPAFRAIPTRSTAVFSPVFSPRLLDQARWLDFYDDWSIAPDINPVHRAVAQRNYSRRSSRDTRATVTCNSPYMARKLRIPLSSVVPNGADARLAEIDTSGDENSRLVIQGHFFRGRTDFRLLLEVATSGAFTEIVVCAPGRSKRMRQVLEALKSSRGIETRVLDWVSDSELASLIGPNTVALIPHVVNDYTLSQDLMKAYKYMLLGVRVICPRLLWPEGLTTTYSFLTDFGTIPSRDLKDWLSGGPVLSHADRARLALAHSWRTRALEIGERISRA